MSVTQKQLAERLGVSQMTVSSALRGTDVVAPETRQRILDAAREMGYRLNTSARAMRDGRTGCIAVVESTADYRSSFFGGALLDGIHDALAACDVHMVVSKLSDEKLVSEAFIPKILREFTADGLLFNYFADIPPRLIELIDRWNIPAVWINSQQPRDSVYLDDYAGGRAATEHLLELGHQRIGYADIENYRPEKLSETNVIHYSIAARFRGFCDALAGAGLTGEPVHCGENVPRDQWAATVRDWLARDDRPTGVVAYSQRNAETLMLAAAQLGLRVPEDLSIVGFCEGGYLATGIHLTGLRFRWALVGKTASELILERVETSGESRPSCCLPYEFVTGQTTAPPGS